MWWLPYIVLEYDKNEVLVDALGGELDSPVWHYRARLYVAAAAAFPTLPTLPVCVYIYMCIVLTLVVPLPLPLRLLVDRCPSSDVSRASEISLSAYLRTAPSVPGQERADMGNDLFLAGVKFSPSYDAVSSRTAHPHAPVPYTQCSSAIAVRQGGS